MAEEKTDGCGCGAGASCCGSGSVPGEKEPRESCCGGSAAGADNRDTACCDPGTPADASKIRKVSLVLLLLFAGVVLVHGLLTKDAGTATDNEAVPGEVRD